MTSLAQGYIKSSSRKAHECHSIKSSLLAQNAQEAGPQLSTIALIVVREKHRHGTGKVSKLRIGKTGNVCIHLPPGPTCSAICRQVLHQTSAVPDKQGCCNSTSALSALSDRGARIIEAADCGDKAQSYTSMIQAFYQALQNSVSLSKCV